MSMYQKIVVCNFTEEELREIWRDTYCYKVIRPMVVFVFISMKAISTMPFMKVVNEIKVEIKRNPRIFYLQSDYPESYGLRMY